MDVLTDEVIARAATGNDPAVLALLDRHGLPAAPGETAGDFGARLTRLREARGALLAELRQRGEIEPARGIRIAADAAVPQNVLREAWDAVEALYDIRPDWVPGFFVTESFGFLWGGCSLSDPASGLNLFIIRKNFRKRRRWLVYDRTELLAHELCHAARQALGDWRFEEYFAYRTAKASLRRWFGNCFVYKFDAWLFLLPILLLPAVQAIRGWAWPVLPVWPFWLLAAIYPFFLAGRNLAAQRQAAQARRKLAAAGAAAPDAVLFRLTASEIRAVADHPDTMAVLDELMAKDLRGAVLRLRLSPPAAKGRQ